MVVILCLVYQMRSNAIGSLNLLCLGIEKKIKYFNIYFVNRYVFHTEEYDHGEGPIIVEFVLRDQFLISLKLIIIESCN